MPEEYDVVVVGAGFAGITAAREFASRGYRTVILEGRDRIGGRTRTGHFNDGTPVDLGGTYLHWIEPHLFSELTRYGLTDKLKRASIPHDYEMTYANGESTWTPIEHDENHELPKALSEVLFEDSATVFPNPANPLLNREAVEAIDHMTLEDRINQLQLSAEDKAYASEMYATMAGRPANEASYSGLLRWFAMAGDRDPEFQDFTVGWKLSTATGGLLDAILADGGAELRLNTGVSEIASDERGGTVTTESGEIFHAKAIVVATPVNVWPYLKFSPGLPSDQLAFAKEGAAGPRSAKAMAIISGEERSFTYSSDESAPVSGFTDRFLAPGEQVITLYPSTEFIAEPPTAEQVSDWLTKALPHVEVKEVLVSSYYEQDPYSRGSWGFLGPGQLTKYEPHVRFTMSGQRIAFATADIAAGFHGWIDGAIESGIRAARDLLPTLHNN